MATAHTPTTAPTRDAASDARGTADPARELVLETIARHTPSLLGVARRYSLCADDAHDAYQRAIEIFLRRAGDLDPQSAPAWLRTVVKHEALAVRAARGRIVGAAEFDPDRGEARDALPAEERVSSLQRVERSAEALARLKPQEVRALVLKAHGYSYREICEITGWTYTKVNRCLTEGRRAFLDRYAEIEAGRECERWAPVLSALADGEASGADVAALRPHLRHCPACRGRLRGFRAAPAAVAALAPAAVLDVEQALAGVGAVAPSPAPGDAVDADTGPPGLMARVYDTFAGGLHDRVAVSAHKLQAGVEAASAGKVAAVAASATALAGGGAAALHQAVDPPPRPAPAMRPASAPAGPPGPSSTGRGERALPGPGHTGAGPSSSGSDRARAVRPASGRAVEAPATSAAGEFDVTGVQATRSQPASEPTSATATSPASDPGLEASGSRVSRPPARAVSSPSLEFGP